MPFAGLGLHIFVALFFAIHAMRSGQNMYWLFILFAFPLLGSIVYFFVIFLPNSKLERGAKNAMSAAAKVLDPTRELREAQAAFDLTPTAQNQMRLASALLEADQAEQALSQYKICLNGPFASDLDIQFGAARAAYAAQQFAQCITYLQKIRATNANFRQEQLGLLLAQAHAATGNAAQAEAEFEQTLHRHGSFESYAEYAIWCAHNGRADKAKQLQTDIERFTKQWSKHTHSLHAPLLKQLQEALRKIS
jgi:hypothetical protein